MICWKCILEGTRLLATAASGTERVLGCGKWCTAHRGLLPPCFPVPAQLCPYTSGLCPALLPPPCSTSRLCQCQNPPWFGTGCCPSRGVTDVPMLQPGLQTACCSHTAATSLAILDLHYE
ncbi:hypothetical protein Anapl_16906 [Anas platyrhynchos]|uniref:Uncharacterized protein n=1 Tax=Anas platyrhynchos TaxID=8839 RepID=R0JGT5_ANAPL|nr:hypothetical protein Anapl_16906 [Anas platyrhynchos]